VAFSFFYNPYGVFEIKKEEEGAPRAQRAGERQKTCLFAAAVFRLGFTKHQHSLDFLCDHDFELVFMIQLRSFWGSFADRRDAMAAPLLKHVCFRTEPAIASSQARTGQDNADQISQDMKSSPRGHLLLTPAAPLPHSPPHRRREKRNGGDEQSLQAHDTLM